MGRKELDSKFSRLRNARREGKQSLTVFADTIGYSRSYLSAVELGYLPETEQIVLAYESALGMGPGTLAEGKQAVARILSSVRPFDAGAAGPEPAEDLPFVEGRMERHSRADIVRGMLSLLREAEARKLPPSTIYWTTFGLGDDFQGEPVLQRQWDHALGQLIRSGWQVTHLLYLYDDVERSLKLVESMFGRLGDHGLYRPLYSVQRGAFSPSQDCLVIPGLAAFLRFGGQQDDSEAGLLLRDEEAIDSLIAHCEARVASSTPLIHWLNRDDRLSFERLLGEVEELPGERMLVRDTIGQQPGVQYGLESDLGWLPEVDARSEELARIRRRRRDTFVAHTARYRFRDVAIKARLEAVARTALLVNQGLILSEGGDRFSPDNIVRLVERTISNLKTLPGYDLALLDDAEVRLIQPAGNESAVFWLVKGGQALFLETWHRNNEGESRHLHFAVQEPSIATAFAEHFKNVWNRIAPRNRDKDHVVWWLQQLIEPLKQYQ